MPQNNIYIPFVYSGKQTPAQLDSSGNLKVVSQAAPSTVIGTVNTQSGTSNLLNITAGAVVVKGTPGRICKVVVNTAGSASGSVSDCATTGAVAAANLVFTIPQTAGVYSLDFPCNTGIVVTAGTGQVLSVSFV